MWEQVVNMALPMWQAGCGDGYVRLACAAGMQEGNGMRYPKEQRIAGVDLGERGKG